ncbi:MAG: hypothetical protein ACJ74Z_19945 [Bryobacteraceae bacterium]|jgi:septal ring factor EnvC (AmiA/AmiB activator)
MTQILQLKTLLVIATIAGAVWLLLTQMEHHMAVQNQRQEQVQKDYDKFRKQLEEEKKKAPVLKGFDDVFKKDLYR